MTCRLKSWNEIAEYPPDVWWGAVQCGYECGAINELRSIRMDLRSAGAVGFKCGFCSMHQRCLWSYAVVRCLSVCLSVCPYVTFVYCIKTSKRNIIPLSPSGSHTILVLQTKPYGSIQTGTPNGDVECRVYEKIAIFDQYLALFRTRYHCYYGTLTWSRMRSIERCHFQWPWMTRNPDFNVTPLSQNISEAVRDREL